MHTSNTCAYVVNCDGNKCQCDIQVISVRMTVQPKYGIGSFFGVAIAQNDVYLDNTVRIPLFTNYYVYFCCVIKTIFRNNVKITIVYSSQLNVYLENIFCSMTISELKSMKHMQM